MTTSFLSDREVEHLRTMVRRNGGSTDDADRVVAWAIETRAAASTLEGVFAGLIRPVVPAEQSADLRFEIDPHHATRIATSGGAS